jgi:hypothetical protein
MLIISDNIIDTDDILIMPDVDIFCWNREPPRLSDYEIVVLDMDVKTNVSVTTFSSKRDDVNKLLEYGGVVICLTHKLLRFGGFCNNYEWLNDSDVANMRIDHDSGIGKNIQLKSKSALMKEYFQSVKTYDKTIWLEDFSEKEIIAVNGVTGEPIACIVRFEDGDGGLVFLPQNSNLAPDKNPTTVKGIIEILYKFGKEVYEKNRESGGIAISTPSWIKKYISSKEGILLKQIEEKQKGLETLRSHEKQFESINDSNAIWKRWAARMKRTCRTTSMLQFPSKPPRKDQAQ